MKRLLMAVCLLAAGSIVVCQSSIAAVGGGCGKGCKGHNSQAQQQVMDAETRKKYDKFMEETVDIQKELAEKLAAYQALMTSENPDPAKAALITEEYYQLRDFLAEKAMQAGIVQKREGCNGCNGRQGVACGLSGPESKRIEKTN